MEALQEGVGGEERQPRAGAFSIILLYFVRIGHFISFIDFQQQYECMWNYIVIVLLINSSERLQYFSTLFHFVHFQLITAPKL